MNRKTASLLMVCAFLWVAVQTSGLLRAPGLLATYDLPTHLHLAAVQMRDPGTLWDDTWYAGYPTYAYPPLAHRFAAMVMARLGLEAGFKVAVAAAYMAAPPAVYAAARIVAGLAPAPAALATLLVVVSPALFRALLFGQYPSLLAFPFFWGAVTAFFAALRAARNTALLAALAALFLGLLGSVHLYPVLLMAVLAFPLILVFPLGGLIRRCALAAVAGVVLASLPSMAFLVDAAQFWKVPVTHITRTAEMVQPHGLLTWILFPAGLPAVLALLILLPAAIRGTAWWAGGIAAGLLLFYLRGLLPGPVLVLAVLYIVFLTLYVRRNDRSELEDPVNRYLVVAGILSLWVALGPAGGLARLLPLADRLVYDRPLMLGVPFGYFALIRALSSGTRGLLRNGVLPTAVGISGLVLLGISLQQVGAQYTQIVPGAQGSFPQGTTIPPAVRELLVAEQGWGRILPLGLPPVAYTLPELVGRPLIDGAYNDARQITPLRRSGLETLGYEKFTYGDLRFTRFFLANADDYGIRWVITGDRYYDRAIPSDRFELVLETGEDPDRSIRVYRSIYDLRPARAGPTRLVPSELGTIGIDRFRSWALVGGLWRVERTAHGSMLGVTLPGSTADGRASAEVDLPAGLGPCNQIRFRAWSPTAASLSVWTLRQGRWSIARPETPLPPRPAWHALAVDCRQVSRLRYVFAGSGYHRAFVSPITLRFSESVAPPVLFEQESPACFRVWIPREDAAVSISLAYHPRWRARVPAAGLRISQNDLGLLTLQGPAGRQDVCLMFPRMFAITRTLLPVAYAGAATLALALLAFSRMPSPRPHLARRLLSVLTTVREVALRHRLDPERAWDLRARQAPDWFIAHAESQADFEAGARADLEDVLGGVDRNRLRGWRVLEVGCGSGLLLRGLAPLVRQAYGVDFSAEMIRLARIRLGDLNNVFTHKNDGHSLSMFADDTFDFIFSFAVFQHIPVRAHIESYLREIFRVVKLGGEVKIQVDGRAESGTWRFLKALIGNDSWSGQFFSRQELRTVVRAHRFEVLRCYRLPGRDGRWPLQGLWVHARKPLPPLNGSGARVIGTPGVRREGQRGVSRFP